MPKKTQDDDDAPRKQINYEPVHLYDMPGILYDDPSRLHMDPAEFALEGHVYLWAHAAYCTRSELVTEMPTMFGDEARWCRLTMPGVNDSPRILAFDGVPSLQAHQQPLQNAAPARRASSGSITASGAKPTTTTIMSVMGTKRNVDLQTILNFAYNRRALLSKLEAIYEQSLGDVKDGDMLLELVVEYIYRLPRGARVHPGIFARAFQVMAMMWQHLELSGLSAALAGGQGGLEDHRVLLYGHSLGAACASIAYVWLRDIYLKGGRDVYGLLDLSCACIACPMFCDDATWNTWFAPHALSFTKTPKKKQPSYVHYHTEGDAFVSDIPSLAGYTRSFSQSCYVCPDASTDLWSMLNKETKGGTEGGGTIPEGSCNRSRAPKKKGNITVDRLLLAHSILQPVRPAPTYASGKAASRPTVFYKNMAPYQRVRAGAPPSGGLRLGF